MLRTKGFSIRTMVCALVVATVVITLGISLLISYRNEKNSLMTMNFQLNHMYTTKISDTVNELFASMKQNLKYNAEHIAKGGLSRPDLDEQVKLIQQTNPMYKAVVVVDKTGKVISIASETDTGLKGKTIETVGAKQALQERKPLISEPYISAANQLIIMVSHPLWGADGEYLGYIGGTIRLHETNLLNTILGDVAQSGNGTYAYVVSASGALLYHPDKSRIGERDIVNPIFAEMLSGHSGVKRIVNSRGVDMLASYTYMKETGWGVVTQTPTDVILTASKRPILRVALYMAPILVLLLLVIYWLIGKMSEPLTKLSNFASVLLTSKSVRDEVPRIHSWNSEANAMHRAFVLAVGQIRRRFDHLSLEAQTDPLTGLYNRRTMDLYIRTWIAEELPFVIMVLDLDHFKQVNDTYGHEMGDEVLRFLAANMQAQFEANHICCRYGGEEFVVLLPETGLETALIYAQNLRTIMEETDSPVGRPVTLSMGIARYPDTAQDAAVLFRDADEALYRAKHLGRNRVETANTAASAHML
ncbi:sensor domain-containing diguanylate cyclase [Paenibacillus sp. BC26]|uniref:sensor domain-containing diguanylate cyclase n=1 Tax=Paenibacillus sp. BC26 TaxID=1881032 RepID=UPI0008EE4687|nr:sensor domain-containing diguanylate cyclase [Paenibacillus sp. BC26]SFT24661.1 diguanylate cyclase (GGDEF) domain-containing protein [Paenibacillus sp. BC26]